MDPQVQDNGGHVRQGQVGSDQRSGVRQLVQLHQSVKNSVREYRPRPERIHRARGADPGLPADGLQVHPRQLHRGLRQHQAADGTFRSRDREMRGQAVMQYEDFINLALGAHK